MPIPVDFFAGAAGVSGSLIAVLVVLVGPSLWLGSHLGLARKRVGVRLAGLAIIGLSLFLLSGLLPRGFGHWSELRDKLQSQVRNVSSNLVGLTEVLDAGWQATHDLDAGSKRSAIRRLQGWVLLPTLMVLTFWVSRWQTDLGALALGIPIVFSAISLAAYYWVVLLVLLLFLCSALLIPQLRRAFSLRRLRTAPDPART